MTIKEFYEQMKGSYDNFIARVGTEERAKKYILMFLADPTIKELNDAIEKKDFESAFRSIHTLKGLSANLALDDFHLACCVLTEVFRNYKGQDYRLELQIVNDKYEELIENIKQID